MATKEVPSWGMGPVMNYKQKFKEMNGRETTLTDGEVFDIFENARGFGSAKDQDEAVLEDMTEMEKMSK